MQNNIPKNDIWTLYDRDPKSQNYGKSYKFNFGYIHNEVIKNTLKNYVWSNCRTQNRTLRSLREFLLKFKYFYTFSETYGLNELNQINHVMVEEFRSYLKTRISTVTKKPLSYAYQKACFDVLKALIYWCRIYDTENAPQREVFTGNEFRGVHRKLKIDFIPDSILLQINHALKNESNPYIKFGIIILETTGMRIGDLVLLKTDCIAKHPISGYTISWYDHKNRQNRELLPVPVECAEAVDQLIRITAKIRKTADKTISNLLFIYEPKIGTNTQDIISVSRQVLGKWFRDFSCEHKIKDNNGQIYTLTSRMFRRTLATDMLSKGANIKVIQEVLGHSSVTTTKLYYADVKDAAMAEIFNNIGIIGDIGEIDESSIPNPLERKWFKDNLHSKARLCDGYCTKPIHNGEICSKLLRRQKCYSCARYITTLDDLEYHKKHLKELEKLLKSNIYGNHYASHFTPTVIILKEIIHRLEALKNAEK